MQAEKKDKYDFNTDNYTDKELYQLLGFEGDKKPSRNAIESSINNLKNNIDQDKNGRLHKFFSQVSNRLLFGAKDKNSVGMWQTEYASVKDPDSKNFVTDRYQQVTTLDDENEHNVMLRNKLNVSTTKNTPVMQGAINPNLKNIISRTVNIDSQYRKNIFDKSGVKLASDVKLTKNTDFILEFSEHLINVLDFKLHAICLPATWYVFSKELGNTCMKIIDRNALVNEKKGEANTLLPYCACIRDGNPTYDLLEDWLNDAYQNILTFKIDVNSHKITIYNITGSNIRIFFYKPHGLSNNTENYPTDSSFNSTQCSNDCYSTGYSNFNLGWELGFRQDPDTKTGDVFIDIDSGESITGPYMVNINGPKYLTLAIDDFNHNHINNGMINILEKSEIVSLPSYYNPSFQGDISKKQLANMDTMSEQDLTQLNEEINKSCSDLSNINNAKIPYVSKNVKVPRKLTAAQIYSINQIIADRYRPSARHIAPGIPNTFAHIPLIDLRSKLKNREHYTVQGSDLHTNTRSYFGPVNIKRMRVTLYDDKGHIVNLNGHNWSFTISVDMLYQY